MKFSVLVNNYNYGRYLVECVESVLAQTDPAHEIIVVDDGSTDDSVERLRKDFGARPEVKILAQRNEGQIIATAVGVEAAEGDILCLLDADDRYQPGYLAALREHYGKRPEVDVTFCAVEPFGEGPRPNFVPKGVWLQPGRDYDYGCTALLTYFGYLHWVGNVMSAISLRAVLARKLGLRQAGERFYLRHGADYMLLLAASLLGGHKYYLHKALVDYRCHGANRSVTKRPGRHILQGAWDNYFRERSGISADMFTGLETELKLVPDPLPEHIRFYRDLIGEEVRKRTPARIPPVAVEAEPSSVSPLRRLERGLRRWRKRMTA